MCRPVKIVRRKLDVHSRHGRGSLVSGSVAISLSQYSPSFVANASPIGDSPLSPPIFPKKLYSLCPCRHR
eukprot:30999-Pelagococcus_subviridis.AAC.3